MKKTLALLIMLLLVLGCTSTAFAAGATPDEAPEAAAKRLEILEPPIKHMYAFPSEAGFSLTEADKCQFESENEELIEQLLLSKFYISINLFGAEIQVDYASSTEMVNIDDCTVKILDPPASLEDIFRDYPVQVGYKGAYDTYTVTVYDDRGFDINTGHYKLISYTEPNKNSYVFEDDAYEINDGSGMLGHYIDLDLTGMTVTLLNKETEQLETFGADSIYCLPLYISPVYPYGHIYALGKVIINEEESYSFSFLVAVTDREGNMPRPPYGTDPDDPSAEEDTGLETVSPDAASPDTASPDSPASGKIITENGAINTGDMFPAAVVFTFLCCASAAIMFISKKKFKNK